MRNLERILNLENRIEKLENVFDAETISKQVSDILSIELKKRLIV